MQRATDLFRARKSKVGMLLMGCLLVASVTQACDMCNYYLPYTPNDQLHSISLNYRYRSAEALALAGPQFGFLHLNPTYFEQDTYLKESFQTIDVWARFHLTDKLMLLGNIPYNINRFTYDGEVVQEAEGLGDISATLLYQVLQTKDPDDRTWRHRLRLGGGFKLPSGNYKMMRDDELIDADYQPGSGSLDVLLAMQYEVRFRKFGWSNQSFYAINSANNLDYTFANGFNWMTNLFYVWSVVDKVSLVPYAGAYFEQAERDVRDGETVSNTGGDLWFAVGGINVMMGPVALRAEYQPLLQESLYDQQLGNNARYNFGIAYQFGK